MLKKRIEFKNVQINIDKNVSNWKAFKAIMTAEGEKGYGLNSLNEVQAAIKVNYINTFEFFSVDQDNGGN